MPLSKRAQAAFDAARIAAERGISEMRNEAERIFEGDVPFVVGVNGSYARREVTKGSDVDLFVLYEGQSKDSALKYQQRFRQRLKSAGYIMPATNGVFDEPLSLNTLLKRIGGMDDTNRQITRRMLLLLEGEWIFNEEEFERTRRKLLLEYVPVTLRDEQICLFLLNDIIRYWRTICVDFEFKVRNDKKARAIRLIKLRFSRMLLFVAGALAIGETYNQSAENKLRILSDLLDLPAIERIQTIAGDRSLPALELYADFLIALDDEKIRQVLSQGNRSGNGEESEAFNCLRVKAQGFRDALLHLFNCHFGKSNPALNALIL